MRLQFCSRYKKITIANFGNPSGSGTKKGYKRVRSKNTSDKGAKKTKSSTKRNIISSISSTELTKLENILKFINHLEILLGQSLEPKTPQPEPQPQLYEVIKRCQHVSKCNGCATIFAKTDEKLYIFGRKKLKWYRKVTSTIKQYKIG